MPSGEIATFWRSPFVNCCPSPSASAKRLTGEDDTDGLNIHTATPTIALVTTAVAAIGTARLRSGRAADEGAVAPSPLDDAPKLPSSLSTNLVVEMSDMRWRRSLMRLR